MRGGALGGCESAPKRRRQPPPGRRWWKKARVLAGLGPGPGDKRRWGTGWWWRVWRAHVRHTSQEGHIWDNGGTARWDSGEGKGSVKGGTPWSEGVQGSGAEAGM